MREGIFGHPASAVFIVLYVLRLVDTKMAVYIQRLTGIDQCLKIFTAAVCLKQICCRDGIGLVSAKRRWIVGM